MKRFYSIIIAALMVFAFVVTSFAVYTGYVNVSDGIHITQDDMSDLNKMGYELSKETHLYFYYSIVEKLTESETIEAYAQSVFETHSNGNVDGGSFVYCVDSDDYYFYTTDGSDDYLPFETKQKVYESYDLAGTYAEAISDYYTCLGELLEGKVAVPTSTAVGETGDKEIPTQRKLPLVVDNAFVIPDDFEATLCEKLESLSNENECEIAIVTVTSTNGMYLTEYADDFYDYNGYGYGENDDGILLMLSMDDRQWHVTTYGKGEDIFSTEQLEQMVQNISGSLSSGDYYGAFDEFADEFQSVINSYNTRPLIWIPIALAIGFAIAWFIIKSMSSGLKSVHSQADADSYVVPNSLSVTRSTDRFLYVNISKTPKPKQNSSGGSHTSSSGRSHGGAGGSF